MKSVIINNHSIILNVCERWKIDFNLFLSRNWMRCDSLHKHWMSCLGSGHMRRHENNRHVGYEPFPNSFQMRFPAIEISHFHWISKKNMLLLIKTYHFTNHRRRHIYLTHSLIESFIQNELRLGLGWKKPPLHSQILCTHYTPNHWLILRSTYSANHYHFCWYFQFQEVPLPFCSLCAPVTCPANSFSAPNLSIRDISEFWWCYSDSRTSHCRIQSFSHSLNDENVKWRSVRMIR